MEELERMRNRKNCCLQKKRKTYINDNTPGSGMRTTSQDPEQCDCGGFSYYAPPSRPEGLMRCPIRGNSGGALVFSMLLWLLYTLGVYTQQEIGVSKLGSSHSTLGRGHLRGSLFWYYFLVLIYGTHLQVNPGNRLQKDIIYYIFQVTTGYYSLLRVTTD